MRYYKMLIGWYYVQNTFLKLNNESTTGDDLSHAFA